MCRNAVVSCVLIVIISTLEQADYNSSPSFLPNLA